MIIIIPRPGGPGAGRLAALATGGWPGDWFDATGFNVWYTYRVRDAYYSAWHTGADLNRPGGADSGAPVYSISHGVVTYARLVLGSSWGRLVVIRHPQLGGTNVYSRYAHLASMRVTEGQAVYAGQPLGTIGGAEWGMSDHLHFDISPTERLASYPTDWPGTDRTRVVRDYVDPLAFLLARIP